MTNQDAEIEKIYDINQEKALIFQEESDSIMKRRYVGII